MPQYDDDQDDVSALTFFSTHRTDDDSGLSALRAQSSVRAQDTTTDADAIRSASEVAVDDAQDDELSEYVVKVTNLPGTVSITALPDGSVLQIDLRPKVTSMSESALAEEILVIADLARQKGLAAQRTIIAQTVQALEFDDGGAAEELIEDSLDLPTPEQAEAAQAEVFATRYATGND